MTEHLDRHRAVIAPVLGLDTDLVIRRAEGLWVYDSDGNRYADFACGTATTNLGHNHPAVVSAINQQAGRLLHAGGVFHHEPLVKAGERLAEITPATIEMFGFANAGAEAVEAAVKLAKHTTGHQAVVAFRGGFHGRTMGSVSYTTSNAKYRDRYHPILGSVFVAPFPHPYRWGVSEEAATELALDELDRMFRHEVSPRHIAAFLVEPVQGEGGYYPAPPAFLEGLRERADRHDIMLIFDEVQTGFGRTARWFASEHYQVDPDIVALGKGIANGLPLSAYGASSEIMNRWPPGAHGTTFGGNPVACAAAIAVIDTMAELLAGAEELSARAFERFKKLDATYPTVGDVRGLGLMIGVELVKDEHTREPNKEAMSHITAHGLQNELIIISCGPDGNVIRFIPPLIATIEDLDRALAVIDEALRTYELG